MFLRFVAAPTVNELAEKILHNYIYFLHHMTQNHKYVLYMLMVSSFMLLNFSLCHSFGNDFMTLLGEEEGKIILKYWKLLLVLFMSSEKQNYTNEAVDILMQYRTSMSDQQRLHFLWIRRRNTERYVGGNIPCDLHAHLYVIVELAVLAKHPVADALAASPGTVSD